MTIDKQALRETAEKALPAMQRLLMMPNDELFDEAALNVDGDVDAANAFNLLAGPETMLALLDENLQLQREKDAIEAVALALRDDMRQAREQLEAAEKRNAEQREYYEGVIADGGKRIAELERTEIREDGNQFLVVRHPGKLPVIKHCVGELEDFLRQLIERDSLVTIDIITHRYYGVGGQWVQDADEYLQMMQGAGIGVKQQEDSVDSDVGRNQPGMVEVVSAPVAAGIKVKGE
ncbi:ead/Ea22-like family protein [Salmonella enterica]|nr:ead/Ea22-like family protein [Salmonella enterica]EBP9559646.1 ead/Ea22-like family protein [Salmonella enterica subsp. enterica]EAZ3654810.1 ead/Ea22-like family protein [Salmonella enterica]ECR9144153.1 ead/Ea22-like family protein [Salmonella enterica]ECW2487895.1 ead/Ea22-like family protein [Salmonella enterica]